MAQSEITKVSTDRHALFFRSARLSFVARLKARAVYQGRDSELALEVEVHRDVGNAKEPTAVEILVYLPCADVTPSRNLLRIADSVGICRFGINPRVHGICRLTIEFHAGDSLLWAQCMDFEA